MHLQIVMKMETQNAQTKEVNNMKKILMIALAVLISVAFVTTVFAAEEKKAEKPAAAAEKAPAAKAEKAPKAEAKEFKGAFVSADAAAKTIVVKGEAAEMTFEFKGKADFKAGDNLVVKYTEKDGKNIAKSVKKEAAKKEKKEEKKADEKKVEKKEEKK